MPWCPECKNEYKEGVKVCADCNTELIEALEAVSDFVPIAGLKEMDYAEKLVEFFKTERIDSFIEESEEEEGFIIHVHEKEIRQAKKLFSAFCSVEAENLIHETLENEPEELEEEEAESIQSYSSSYVNQLEKSKDLKSTAIMFLFFGIAGIIFLLLNIIGVIGFLNHMFAYIVVGVMFIGCVLIGIHSLKDSKKAEKNAVLEDKLTNQLNQWLQENMSEETISSFKDSNQSDEVNFLAVMDGIKKSVTETLGDMDEAFLDTIIEEYYNEHFE